MSHLDDLSEVKDFIAAALVFGEMERGQLIFETMEETREDFNTVEDALEELLEDGVVVYRQVKQEKQQFFSLNRKE